MKRRAVSKLTVLIIVICLMYSQVVFAANSTTSTGDANNLEYLKSIMDMIKDKYNGNVTDQQLTEGAVKGMFGTMDPYTTYFTSEEYKSFYEEVGGKFTGIGIMMAKVGDYIIVSKVFSDSPAEKSGISVGDKIVSVDGKSYVGGSLDEIAAGVKGEEGTKVTLGIIKSEEKSPINVEVTRAEIKVNPVTYEIKDGIGYIALGIFNENASGAVNQALDYMDKNNVTKIVLDLRGNPGGEVNQAVAIAQSFVPEGLITKLEFKSKDLQTENYYSHLKTPKYKLAVLVNEMSASASEILAGAIQDTKAGTLIGTKTYGKGVVQDMYPLLTPEAYQKYEKQLGVNVVNAYDLYSKYKIDPLTSEVIGWSKITIGEYSTPNGRKIDKQGLTPDIAVGDPAASSNIDVYSVQKLEKVNKPALNSESIDVYNAEKILKLEGYDVDTPDMKLDEKTSKALAKFQEDMGGYPSGVLDYTTQQWLNQKLDQLILQIDTQYNKAVEMLNN